MASGNTNARVEKPLGPTLCSALFILRDRQAESGFLLPVCHAHVLYAASRTSPFCHPRNRCWKPHEIQSYLFSDVVFCKPFSAPVPIGGVVKLWVVSRYRKGQLLGSQQSCADAVYSVCKGQDPSFPPGSMLRVTLRRARELFSAPPVFIVTDVALSLPIHRTLDHARTRFARNTPHITDLHSSARATTRFERVQCM